MSDWAHYADYVLRDLFVKGQPAPTRKQITEAYPFGPRQYHPYKVWLARVKAWRAAHASGMSRPFTPRRTMQTALRYPEKDHVFRSQPTLFEEK